jgi:glycosyltransferase involved in cell wall biosynthesis
MTQHRFAFVLDQQVGLRTQALNLERVVGERTEIDPLFVPVRYGADAGLLARLPLLPGGMRGTLRGVREIRDGLKNRRLDAVLWATWAAKSVPDLVAASPAVLVMDMTPVQMEEMGALYNYSRARLLGGWKRRATNRLYRTAHHFYPWSRFVADSLVGEYGVPAEKVTVVSPGVDLDLYRPVPMKPMDTDTVRLLFVGGDLVRKGGDLLLRCLDEYRAKRQAGGPQVELHLVTRDTPPSPLPDGVHLHQGLTNNSPELIRLYQSCDIFVLPTRADCYSLVALEAMACGLPVIISRLGGIPDIVTAETGRLILPDDYDALSAALEALVTDPDLRRRMGRAGRCRAEAHFDCRENIGRLLIGMRAAAENK